MRRTTTEDLIEQFDTTTNPVTQAVLKDIINERLEDNADYREWQQPKDYPSVKEGENK